VRVRHHDIGAGAGRVHFAMSGTTGAAQAAARERATGARRFAGSGVRASPEGAVPVGRVVGLLMVAVMVAVLVGLHWYVWRRLVRDSTVAGSVARWAGTAVVVTGGLFMVGTLASRIEAVPFGIVRVVSTVGYLWAAVLIYLLLGVLIGEVVRPLLMRVAARRGARSGAPGAGARATAVPEGGARAQAAPEAGAQAAYQGADEIAADA